MFIFKKHTKAQYKYYINWIKVVQTIHALYSKASEAIMMVIVIDCSHKLFYDFKQFIGSTFMIYLGSVARLFPLCVQWKMGQYIFLERHDNNTAS